MEIFSDGHELAKALLQYGSISLFFLLALGIIALPVPEETLMVLAGVLMSKGKLHIGETVIAACAGSISGITVSYLMGRLAGKYVFTQYGPYFGLTAERLELVHNWFERFGKWTLFFGYFVPGVRHFTGVTAGMAKLEFPVFALFAYTGAVMWASVFLSLGYFVGDHWISEFRNFEVGFELFAILAVLLLALLFIGRYFKINKK